MARLVAVTGANGFIGREICRALQELGAQPIGIARASRDERETGTTFPMVVADLDNPTSALEQLSGCHSLIDLAWENLDDYNSDSHFTISLPQHYRFLAAATDAGIERIVGVGTCFEYGMREGELDESLVADPRNAYAFAKHALHCELDFLSQRRSFGLTWVRPFYLYGDGSSRRSIYRLLAEAVARGDEAFRMSPGEQLRDYLPVAVVARRIAQLALLDESAGTVNICSGEPRSMRGLVEGWIRANDWDIDLDLGYYPYSRNEPHAFWGDSTKLKQLIGDDG